MNTNESVTRSQNATIRLNLADAVAQGFVKAQPNGHFSIESGKQVSGPAVDVRVRTGEIVEDGVELKA